MGQSSFGSASASALPSLEAIKHWLINQIAILFGIEFDKVEIEAPFARYGIDSMQAVTIVRALGELVGRKLNITAIWEYPTIESLARYAISSTAGLPAHT